MNLSPVFNQPDDVAEVTALDDFRLHVRFVDGLEGDVDMKGLVHSPKAGIFAQLAGSELFSQVFVEYGAVTWPGEIDLAPDAMHSKLEKQGEWTLD